MIGRTTAARKIRRQIPSIVTIGHFRGQTGLSCVFGMAPCNDEAKWSFKSTTTGRQLRSNANGFPLNANVLNKWIARFNWRRRRACMSAWSSWMAAPGRMPPHRSSDASLIPFHGLWLHMTTMESAASSAESPNPLRSNPRVFLLPVSAESSSDSRQFMRRRVENRSTASGTVSRLHSSGRATRPHCRTAQWPFWILADGPHPQSEMGIFSERSLKQ